MMFLIETKSTNVEFSFSSLKMSSYKVEALMKKWKLVKRFLLQKNRFCRKSSEKDLLKTKMI